MRVNVAQITMEAICTGVFKAMEEKKPELISMLEEHLDFDRLIPASFHRAYYKWIGRPPVSLDGMVKSCVLQTLFGFTEDSQLIAVLKCSRELRKYCGFDTVPSKSKFSRFKRDYCDELRKMFEHLVDLTEPICREINEKKADYLIYDTTGIEVCVAENNPKFLNTKLKEAKKFSRNNPSFDPYKGVYALLPETASANPDVKQQYINGHYCYALKAGILTNGLGIVRHIAFFDTGFKERYPELVSKKSDNPDFDKEIADSKSLKPVLSDFLGAHPDLSYKTFLGDSAFDCYDIYAMLRNDFHFDRACIPLNPRNSGNSLNSEFDAGGTPVCPLDKRPFTFLGISGGNNRSKRFKWVCPESKPSGTKRICTCATPCTDSTYGRCVYTYPDKDFRLYPGIPRNTDHWNNLYRHRVTIERTIQLFKDSFGLGCRKSLKSISAKAQLFLAGITQLLGVLLASALGKRKLFKSVRKLITA